MKETITLDEPQDGLLEAVQVLDDTSTTQDETLALVPNYELNGTVVHLVLREQLLATLKTALPWSKNKGWADHLDGMVRLMANGTSLVVQTFSHTNQTVFESSPISISLVADVMVEAKTLVQTLQLSTAKDLYLSCNNERLTLLVGDGGKFSAATYPLNDLWLDATKQMLPDLSAIAGATPIAIDCKWLKLLADYCSKDTLRPAMCCVNVGLSESGLRYVATDGHRLGILKTGNASTYQDALISANICKMLPSLYATIEVYKSQGVVYGRLTFANDVTSLVVVRLQSERFPDFEAAIPTVPTVVCTIEDANGFVAGLETVSRFANHTTKAVTLEDKGDGMLIATAQDLDYSNEGESYISVSYLADWQRQTFNGDLLQKSIRTAAIFGAIEASQYKNMLVLKSSNPDVCFLGIIQGHAQSQSEI